MVSIRSGLRASIATALAAVAAGQSLSPAPTPWGSARFAADSIIVLRGTLSTSTVGTVTLVEYSPSGTLLSQIPLPIVTNTTATRCAVRYTADLMNENFIQRSFTGDTLIFGCNDISITNS